MANVKEVEWQGGIYNIADEVARGEAQQARALADTAQATAERALTAAGNAQNAAGAAQDTADDAQIIANAAQTTADSVQTSFSNYKALGVRYVNFATTGRVTFAKRGLICEITMQDPSCAAGTYNIPIPDGFIPITGTTSNGLLVTHETAIMGYYVVSEGQLVIHVETAGAIGFSHVFLM